MGVGDDLTGVVALAQCVSDELVEAELLGPGDLDDAVRERAGHVLGGDGLDEHVCQAHRGAAGGRIGDAPMNSKNWVAWTIEWGIGESSIASPGQPSPGSSHWRTGARPRDRQRHEGGHHPGRDGDEAEWSGQRAAGQGDRDRGDGDR